MWNSYLKYTITSEDLTSPSRFSLEFSAIRNMVEFRNASSMYGIRVYSLNSSCRVAKLTSPYTRIWDTEAYSAQIGLHPSILTHAAGFSVKVGQGTKPPVCTDERGTNMAAMFFDVNLLGPCANADLNIQEIRLLLIFKTHQNTRCCSFNGYIYTNSIQGYVELFLFLEENSRKNFGITNDWPLLDRDNNVKFQVLCTQACLAIIIEIWPRSRSSSKTFRIGYHAKLIEQSDFTGVTFTQIQLPIGFLSPRPRMLSLNQVCLHHRCYITPNTHMVVTWDQAKRACEGERATLYSINSDLEWALLTRLPQQTGVKFIELYEISDIILLYIGLVSDVSTHRIS